MKQCTEVVMAATVFSRTHGDRKDAISTMTGKATKNTENKQHI
jgi:hypothetical protein